MKAWFREMKAWFRDMKAWFRNMKAWFRNMKVWLGILLTKTTQITYDQCVLFFIYSLLGWALDDIWSISTTDGRRHLFRLLTLETPTGQKLGLLQCFSSTLTSDWHIR